ncbi:uncharacterized protein LOC126976152 isoform X2 [Leptidea sinapis]|uniref:uncharacterized protein LOC126976152 isoform X2 n=1 Tax=Leptidea sinapis TaxID=189913 RepID=UPI0021C2F0D4|nr:uncharacterized protein LOC126976152 isoform X2 [Leptidea sinapis]
MLLIIHNLPACMHSKEIKDFIIAKSGIQQLVVDNLMYEKSGKKQVTVGLLNEGDAAIFVRKINSLYLYGEPIYIDNVGQKTAQMITQPQAVQVPVPPVPMNIAQYQSNAPFYQTDNYIQNPNALQSNIGSAFLQPNSLNYDKNAVEVARNSVMSFQSVSLQNNRSDQCSLNQALQNRGIQSVQRFEPLSTTDELLRNRNGLNHNQTSHPHVISNMRKEPSIPFSLSEVAKQNLPGMASVKSVYNSDDKMNFENSYHFSNLNQAAFRLVKQILKQFNILPKEATELYSHSKTKVLIRLKGLFVNEPCLAPAQAVDKYREKYAISNHKSFIKNIMRQINFFSNEFVRVYNPRPNPSPYSGKRNESNVQNSSGKFVSKNFGKEKLDVYLSCWNYATHNLAIKTVKNTRSSHIPNDLFRKLKNLIHARLDNIYVNRSCSSHTQAFMDYRKRFPKSTDKTLMDILRRSSEEKRKTAIKKEQTCTSSNPKNNESTKEPQIPTSKQLQRKFKESETAVIDLSDEEDEAQASNSILQPQSVDNKEDSDIEMIDLADETDEEEEMKELIKEELIKKEVIEDEKVGEELCPIDRKALNEEMSALRNLLNEVDKGADPQNAPGISWEYLIDDFKGLMRTRTEEVMRNKSQDQFLIAVECAPVTIAWETIEAFVMPRVFNASSTQLFTKISEQDQKWIVGCKNFEVFDKLCKILSVRIGDVTVTFEPFNLFVHENHSNYVAMQVLMNLSLKKNDNINDFIKSAKIKRENTTKNHSNDVIWVETPNNIIDLTDDVQENEVNAADITPISKIDSPTLENLNKDITCKENLQKIDKTISVINENTDQSMDLKEHDLIERSCENNPSYDISNTETDCVINENIIQSIDFKEHDLVGNEQKSCENNPNYDISNNETDRDINKNTDQSMDLKEHVLIENEQKSFKNNPSYNIVNTETDSILNENIDLTMDLEEHTSTKNDQDSCENNTSCDISNTETDRVTNENIDQSMELKEPYLIENEQQSCENNPNYDISSNETDRNINKNSDQSMDLKEHVLIEDEQKSCEKNRSYNIVNTETDTILNESIDLTVDLEEHTSTKNDQDSCENNTCCDISNTETDRVTNENIDQSMELNESDLTEN